MSFAIGLQVQVQDDKQGKSGTSYRQESHDFKQSGKGFEIIRGDGGFLFNQEVNADKKTEKVKVDQEKESEIVKKEDMMTKENFKKKDMLLSRGPLI